MAQLVFHKIIELDYTLLKYSGINRVAFELCTNRVSYLRCSSLRVACECTPVSRCMPQLLVYPSPQIGRCCHPRSSSSSSRKDQSKSDEAPSSSPNPTHHKRQMDQEFTRTPPLQPLLPPFAPQFNHLYTSPL